MEKQACGNGLDGSKVQVMPIERRQSPREECNVRAVIIFRNREVTADLRNFSIGGALLSIAQEDNHMVTAADEGKEITFLLTNGKSNVNFKGIIGRYSETEDNRKYLAIHFSQRPLHRLM